MCAKFCIIVRVLEAFELERASGVNGAARRRDGYSSCPDILEGVFSARISGRVASSSTALVLVAFCKGIGLLREHVAAF